MTAAELRAWIKSRHLTQAEAAEVLGLSHSQLQHILGGRHPVGRQTELLTAALAANGAAAPEEE
ncbi:MAG TPA: helix-turn-helix transcriptional regulator [Stellaceae bacterium]|nr:helix-turn-helix transcriptional regulator [Stellaceae bacterium]